LALGLYVFAGCKDNSGDSKNRENVPADLLYTHLDTTVHPGDDFFTYANGGWVKQNKIPDSESGWGIFNLVADENYAQLRKLSEDASSAASSPGTAMQQIGDFFFTGMDSAGIEKNGITPLQPVLTAIDSVTNPQQLVAVITRLQMIGADVAYNLGIEQDMMNSERYRVYLVQGGLGLPDRDYYFNTDTRTRGIRDAYLQHIQHTLETLQPDSTLAKKQATSIFELEKELATAHKKLEELRDPYANYHPTGVMKLDENSKVMKWNSIFAAMQIKTDTVIVGQPAFFTKLNQLLGSTPLETWKNYLRWHVLRSYAAYLPAWLDTEHFNFYSKVLNGAKTQRPRWKRVIDAEEEALGDALGQLFVKEYFPEKTKKRYENLVEQIVISYGEHIQKLDWMGDSTKKKALDKLNAITRKVGYPSKWKDYSAMKLNRNSYCGNVMESRRWQFNYHVSKLNKPVDRSEWGMTPQTYNAYYNPSNNEIVLPAAIFSAPGYKDEELDDAIVYGYVGASTIGHELTHGFDDEGRQFDAQGNLKNWWTKDDEEHFKKRAAMLVDQFNSFVVLDSLHVNGKATLGENIADLGGIVIALDAFKKTQQYKEGKSINGLTPLQRYFLGYAYGWMQVRRPEKLAAQILTDVHAPIFLRVNGPMSNCDAWYEAFQVKPENKLYRSPEQRVRIW
ncbi:MAG TPA: M13 family metallopeptidase, partial [Chitinophagaceae bacterium]|nr:M13 family metallopeptidase [Chitinophagaceae bacterium]